MLKAPHSVRGFVLIPWERVGACDGNAPLPMPVISNEVAKFFAVFHPWWAGENGAAFALLWAVTKSFKVLLSATILNKKTVFKYDLEVLT